MIQITFVNNLKDNPHHNFSTAQPNFLPEVFCFIGLAEKF